jgi:hypothetical protein
MLRIINANKVASSEGYEVSIGRLHITYRKGSIEVTAPIENAGGLIRVCRLGWSNTGSASLSKDELKRVFEEAAFVLDIVIEFE